MTNLNVFHYTMLDRPGDDERGMDCLPVMIELLLARRRRVNVSTCGRRNEILITVPSNAANLA